MYKGAIFDWDGTLADTRKAILTSFQQALNTIGIQADPQFIERQIGTGAAHTFKEILQKQNKPYNDQTIKQLIQTKIQTQIKLANTVKLLPGAKNLLQTLQGKTKLALASMNHRPVIDTLLKAKAIGNYFDAIISVEDVHNFKPNPEIFLKAAQKLQLQPTECVVIEDSIFGVQAAKNAGTACIAVLTGVYKKEELEKANPALIVNSLREKTKILNFILQ